MTFFRGANAHGGPVCDLLGQLPGAVCEHGPAYNVYMETRDNTLIKVDGSIKPKKKTIKDVRIHDLARATIDFVSIIRPNMPASGLYLHT